MSRAGVVVVGSGSLARAVCSSVATVTSGITVHVMARSRDRVNELCYLATTRAALAGGGTRFLPVVTDLESSSEVAARLALVEPGVLVNCASYQSPWERIQSASAWTELLDRAGFGATLPLQAALAIDLARALTQSAPSTLFVNACFPDAVNPVVAALGLPVLCGIGNVAVLAATLQAGLGLPDQRELRVLGHHHHLRPPADPADEARAWHGDRCLDGVGALLAGQRATARPLLNEVAGAAAGRLLGDLLSGSEILTSLPGPLGLTGGYPVRIADRRIELNLPDGVDREQAIAWNERIAVHDGVCVRPSGEVRFSPRVQHELGGPLPDVAAGYHVTETAEVCSRMLELRCRLRGARRCPA
jgi:hypothetical protein